MTPTDLAAAPDHFAVASGPGVARKRQPQFGRQRVGIVDRDLRPRRGQILHHALARGKAAFERDPAGLMQRFARFALFARVSSKAMSEVPPANSPTPCGFRNRCEYRCPRRVSPSVAGARNCREKRRFRAACPPGQTPLYVRPSPPPWNMTAGDRHGQSSA